MEKHAYVKLAPFDEPLEGQELFDYDDILKKKRDYDVDCGSKIQPK